MPKMIAKVQTSMTIQIEEEIAEVVTISMDYKMKVLE